MKKMTIADAARKYVADRDAEKMFKLLDHLEVNRAGNPYDLPLICDLNHCGREGHSWAWDILEEWQHQDV